MKKLHTVWIFHEFHRAFHDMDMTPCSYRVLARPGASWCVLFSSLAAVSALTLRIATLTESKGRDAIHLFFLLPSLSGLDLLFSLFQQFLVLHTHLYYRGRRKQ